MYDITIICTHHTELGKCNSDELYKIIESINPEVIFDELPADAFNLFYSDSFDTYYYNSILLNQHPPELPLEVKCIKKYMQAYNIKIFPVDIDGGKGLAKSQDEISFMFSTFFKNEGYQKLDNENEALIAQKGFHYLNSDKFLNFLVEKEIMEKKTIETESQKDSLLNIYKLFHSEQYDNRENTMLENIYNYSKGNQYSQAVFLIGAEHKKSLMQKITEYEKLAEINLNWAFYNGLSNQ